MDCLKKACVLPAVVLMLAQTVWAQTPGFAVTGFNIQGNTLLAEPAAQSVVAPFVGSDRSMDDIKRAAAALKEAYVAQGYPIVQVFAPEQLLTGGTVTLRVVEGRVAKISVAGNKAYDVANIRGSLPSLQTGSAPNASRIISEVVLANENPAKQVAVNFAAGATAGEIDARIDVVEDRIEKFAITADNAGSRSTGIERFGFSYQNANLMNLDHQLTLQYMTTFQHPDKVANLTGSYRMPFYTAGMSLDLIASYSDSKSNASSAAGPLFFSGKGTYLGIRFNQALTSQGDFRHKLVYGLDYKNFNNECSLSGIALTNCGTITDIPASLSYIAQIATPGYQAGGSIGYYRNIPGGDHGDQASYGTHERNWDAWRISGFYGVPIGNWQLRATANVQEASKTLIPSEQFGLGGAASVRGYDERTLAGDYGIAGNLELYTPEFAKHVGLGDNVKLRALLFHDVGYVRNVDPALVRQTQLSSLGLGLRINIGKDLSAKLDVGYAQTATPVGAAGLRDKHQSFGHAAAAYSF